MAKRAAASRKRKAAPKTKATPPRDELVAPAEAPDVLTLKTKRASGGSGQTHASDVVPTIAEAAKRIGVHERTLKTWLARGAPGRAGAYDLAAIAVWHEATIGPIDDEELSEQAKWRARREAASAQLEELKLEQRRGHLVDVDLAARHYARHIAEAKVLLEQLPDQLLAQCPTKLPKAAKKVYRQSIQRALAEIMTTLAAGVEERPGADPAEDEEEPTE